MFSEWHRLLSILNEWCGHAVEVEVRYRLIGPVVVLAVLRGPLGAGRVTGHLDAWDDGEETVTLPVGQGCVTLVSSLMEDWELVDDEHAVVVAMLDRMWMVLRPV